MPSLFRLLRERLRMMADDARAVAHTVESAFRGEDELDDETISKDLRQLFYDLQDMDVLEVRRREFVRDGQRLRGYTWHIREAAGELVRMDPRRTPADEDTVLYESLGDQAWERRRPGA